MLTIPYGVLRLKDRYTSYWWMHWIASITFLYWLFVAEIFSGLSILISVMIKRDTTYCIKPQWDEPSKQLSWCWPRKWFFFSLNRIIAIVPLNYVFIPRRFYRMNTFLPIMFWQQRNIWIWQNCRLIS